MESVYVLCFVMLCVLPSLSPLVRGLNLSLTHQHPHPEAVVQHVQRRLNASISRRQLQVDQCLTGNPIDDCWRCGGPDWAADRQRMADCAVGFGRGAAGGRGGAYYVVTDPSDRDAANPVPGTLRHAVIQTEPLWVVFSGDMTITLRHELIVASFKTIDGRGANVHLTGGGCVTLQYVSHVIVHNIRISGCVPSGNTLVRSSPEHVGWRGRSDGDGISIFAASNIWIDHCSLSYCTDGLIDAIMGSTAITISNNYFSHHNEVMLLGHNDNHLADSGMQVTIAFNQFGEGLVQRMPRCRHGYIHVVNNDFREWKMYAIGGSASPTINSQGNRYTAPIDPNAKEVTKRVETDEKEWGEWNWRTEGDIMVNGAYFVPSGQGLSNQYAKATSVEAIPAGYIDQLTFNAGVFNEPKESSSGSISYSSGETNSGRSGTPGGSNEGYYGMIFQSNSRLLRPLNFVIITILSIGVALVLFMNTNSAVFSSVSLQL